MVAVAENQAGERLDRVLAGAVALSRTRLKGLILAGEVAIGWRTIRDPGHRVNAGDAITVNLPPPEEAAPVAEAIPLEVVYEDDDLIVIDKPAGLVVHPAAGNETGTLVNALIAHCGESLSGIGGERRPGIVHRLDKDTTGLMVVAKNDRAHRALAIVSNGEPKLVVEGPDVVTAQGKLPRGEVTGHIRNLILKSTLQGDEHRLDQTLLLRGLADQLAIHRMDQLTILDEHVARSQPIDDDGDRAPRVVEHLQ